MSPDQIANIYLNKKRFKRLDINEKGSDCHHVRQQHNGILPKVRNKTCAQKEQRGKESQRCNGLSEMRPQETPTRERV